MPAADAPPVDTLSDAEFKAQLVKVIPQLRAFGRSLSGNRETADDLVQETLLKAWAARDRYSAGTNLRAWTFIILRNLFLSQMRRTRFHGEWDDGAAERALSAPSGQDKIVELSDVYRALQFLPPPQREAIVLVGAGGFSYDEAADICGVAVGTIKSRVARGRIALDALLDSLDLPSRRGEKAPEQTPLEAIIDEVKALSRGV